MRDQEKHPALDECGEAHGDSGEEEGVNGVVEHDGPDFGVEGVAQETYHSGQREQNRVEDEEG